MRRKETGLEALFAALTVLPAWVGPALAVVLYLVIRYLIPHLMAGSESGEATAIGRDLLSKVFQAAAPFVAGFVLLVWIMVEVKKRMDRRLLDKTGSIEDIRNLSWREFERLVAEAYRRQGYEVEETGSPSGDGGVDLILHSDGKTSLVQCKHWRERHVGVKTVRELYGVMHDRGAERGIIACCGHYTRDAEDFAERNGIELVTGLALRQMIHEVKVKQEPHAPEKAAAAESSKAAHPEESAAPLCPVCGANMVLRTARRGRNAGTQFWGCSRYPRCRGTRQF